MKVYMIIDNATKEIVSIDHNWLDGLDSFIDWLWDDPKFTKTLSREILNLDDNEYRDWVLSYSKERNYDLPGLYALVIDYIEDYDYNWETMRYTIK